MIFNLSLSLGLFQRIDNVFESRLSSDMKYSKEQVLLIERVHLDFVRAGAKFDAEAQLKYGKIMENLAVLTTKFAQVHIDKEDTTIMFCSVLFCINDTDHCHF